MSNKLSPKLDWVESEITHQLGTEDEDCECKDLDFCDKDADWMMCPICKRLWVRKWRRR